MINDKILVSVLITTFNQEKFINEAIEGALNQNTDFFYEIVIGDDCSTDKTREICINYQKQFPGKIKLLTHEKHLGIINNFCETFRHCQGQYIAQCDGDDYWIDSNKLQKQVDYLELKRDFVMVYTDKQPRIDNIIYKPDGPKGILETNFESILLANMICSATILIRTEIVNQYLITNAQLASNLKWSTLDYPLWLDLSLSHKIGYIPEVTCVYRIVSNSGSHPKDKLSLYAWDKSILDIQIYYFNKKLQQQPKFCISSLKNSFHEMIFHKRKRMLIDYGWIARKQIFPLISMNLYYLMIIVYRKMIRTISCKQ